MVAIWGFLKTDTFMSGLIRVVNIGNDTDTVGAVYCQIAGVYYGFDKLPIEWINQIRLHKNDMIMELTNKFLKKYVM
jgi:ADP-ribosyl-[dinitrogen reductase] hydrolase